MVPESSRLLRRGHAPQRKIGERMVVAHPKTGVGMRFNEPTTLVWDLLADPCSETELRDKLSEALPWVDHEMVADGLARILRDLDEVGLLERPGS